MDFWIKWYLDEEIIRLVEFNKEEDVDRFLARLQEASSVLGIDNRLTIQTSKDWSTTA